MTRVEWAPQLPPSWGSGSLRWLTQIYAGGTPDRSNADYWADGAIPWLNSGAVNDWAITRPSELISEEGFAHSSARWVPAQSVVIGLAGQGKTKGTSARLEITSTTNQSMAAIVPGPRLDYRFLHYWLVSNYRSIRNLAGGDKRDGLNLQHIASIQCPLPPLAEQRAIADYLDRETAQIDTLISKQEQLIATLRERRVVIADDIVAERVGRGVRLKRSITEVDHRAGHASDDLPLLSVSIAWGVRRRDEVSAERPRADDLSIYKIADAGEIVINRMRAFQGALGVAPVAGVVSPDYAVLRCPLDVVPTWLATVMHSTPFIAEMSQRLKGIGGTESGLIRTPRINISDLLDIAIDTPQLETQHADLARIKKETVRIDTLIAKAGQFIALSRERRAALITAAVTGQIDVSTAA